MEPRSFSYKLERAYYSRSWPKEAQPYLHLERYLRCWLDPEAVFGNKRILDIGSGECTYIRLIAERFAPEQVVACELFRERMLPAALENVNPTLKFIAGDCFRLPFQERSFDVVFASGVMSQLPNLADALRETKRVLRNGGHYVGWDPNPLNPFIAYRYIFKPHSANQYLFWPWRTRSAFEKAGFEVNLRYFYVKLPRSRSCIVGTCIGILARKRDG